MPCHATPSYDQTSQHNSLSSSCACNILRCLQGLTTSSNRKTALHRLLIPFTSTHLGPQGIDHQAS